jgi:hypothetical protein
MPHRTTQPYDLNKTLAPPLTWAKAACAIVGRRLHASTDAIAAQLGWDVTITHWGLGRVYHDSRFGELP